MRYPVFVVAAAKTAVNVTAYVVTRGRLLLLEGRWRRGWYANWSGDRRHRAELARPATEDEVVALVRASSSLRVVGAGHSFNDALATTGATVSLDNLAGVVRIDRDTQQVVVWGGTRLRDLTRRLRAEGLAIRSLASHDAQSIAGIVSTDVHGTGRGPAHFSDQVLSLRLVDGDGAVHEVGPEDELFRAAVGGIGAVGIITQVTIQCVDAFSLRQTSMIETRRWAEDHLDQLLRDHDHVSLYVYPFTDLVHVHTWDRTEAPNSPLGGYREALNEAKAALAVATVGDAFAHLGRLPKTATPGMRLQAATNLVLHSNDAFSRTQYHLHQELEVAVPLERVWDALDQTLQIYERLYAQHRLPFLLVEVRFTPAGHTCSLLGPGVDRASAWLCLCCNQSGAVDSYFNEVEQWLRSTDARVHLGKWCETLDATDIARMHGARFDRFQQVRSRADPDGKFLNPFLERVLGHPGTR